MKKYKAVFFDLDHTLWDFEKNSHEAITELCNACRISEKGIDDIENFISVYREINSGMWEQYQKNLISKEILRSGRFSRALQKFNVHDDELAHWLSGEYLRICPVKTHLFPGTHPVLEYLSKKYSLHIITNGFKEVQHLKIKGSGIDKYFTGIHISEEIGFKKPQPEIFHYAVQQAGTVHEHCVMIGDNPDTDISGAINAGIDTIFFNPLKTKNSSGAKFQIHHLEELLSHL